MAAERIEIPSRTYKFRTDPKVSDYAFYFTIVGGANPEGLFVNSKRLDEFQWITALMESYYRQLRAGVSVQDVIRDMKATFDPNGHYYVDGQEVKSMVHHMGLILEKHVEAFDDE